MSERDRQRQERTFAQGFFFFFFAGRSVLWNKALNVIICQSTRAKGGHTSAPRPLLTDVKRSGQVWGGAERSDPVGFASDKFDDTMTYVGVQRLSEVLSCQAPLPLPQRRGSHLQRGSYVCRNQRSGLIPGRWFLFPNYFHIKVLEYNRPTSNQTFFSLINVLYAKASLLQWQRR